MKKNYFYLSLAIIAMTYNAWGFIFYPELVPQWFLRFIGGLFLLYAIGYLLDMKKLYLQNEINRLDTEIRDSLEAKKDIISDWLEKNGDPEIAKQVELELEELCVNQSTKERIISETSESTKQKAIDYGNDLAAKQETLEEAANTYFETLPEPYNEYLSNPKNGFIAGAKWEQEQDKNKFSEEYIAEKLFNHPVMDRIRSSKSDAEARRIIRSVLFVTL